MDLHSRILGCLLGTAVGDAVGLRREGLSRRRAMRLYGGSPLEASLIFGLGFCSDDTEHTAMVGRALARSSGDRAKFERLFANDLKRWLLTGPAGLGLGTLHACCKLILGFGPERSGVNRPGNGPAMRSALIGLFARSDQQLRELAAASTRLTHIDPRAEEGALVVALAARHCMTHPGTEPIDFLRTLAAVVVGAELSDKIEASVACLAQEKSCAEYAETQGWSRGISGYVNQTVPAALYCWARWDNDFRSCVEEAVLLGGDADSVGAIAGAICGANLGHDAIPESWLKQLVEWPRGIEWMERLADSLAEAIASGRATDAPSMRWLATIPRNLLFGGIVVSLALRRWLPPY